MVFRGQDLPGDRRRRGDHEPPDLASGLGEHARPIALRRLPRAHEHLLQDLRRGPLRARADPAR